MKSVDTRVEFEAKDKTWTLELTNRSIRALQNKLKRPMGKVAADLVEGSIEDMLAIFCAGLKARHPDVTEEQAIDMVGPKLLTGLVGKLLEATYGDEKKDAASDQASNPQGPSQQQ